MQASGRPTRCGIFTLLLLPTLVTAIIIDCEHVKVKDDSFNLKPLSGPRSVNFTEKLSDAETKVTTYTIDLCKALIMEPDRPCHTGTRVCAVERIFSTLENNTTISTISKTIAGDISNYGGPANGLDPNWALLSESGSSSDAGKEGLRLTMHGGRWPDTGKDRRDQQAIIEFVCDKERTGLDDENEEHGGEALSTLDDSDSKSLTFVSYPGTDKKLDTLHLNWRTKYACADVKKDTDAEQRSQWGFFTWFILIAFLGTATYLIFGSWLNYSRYGARGWDLLPHGDTIRDVPYLMKDWTRKVVTTVQGGGSRGGYAAV